MQTLKSSTGRTEVRLGDKADFVDIRAEEGLLVIEVVGAPPCSHILQAIRRGYTEGWILTEMPTLVDVSAFHGNIDWASIKAISQMAEWGGRTPTARSRVAYLSPDPFFALVVKAVSILFFRSTHRLFADRQTALAWLRDTRPDALAS